MNQLTCPNCGALLAPTIHFCPRYGCNILRRIKVVNGQRLRESKYLLLKAEGLFEKGIIQQAIANLELALQGDPENIEIKALLEKIK